MTLRNFVPLDFRLQSISPVGGNLDIVQTRSFAAPARIAKSVARRDIFGAPRFEIHIAMTDEQASGGRDFRYAIRCPHAVLHLPNN